jgi:hypothetical protein
MCSIGTMVSAAILRGSRADSPPNCLGNPEKENGRRVGGRGGHFACIDLSD